MENFTQCQGIAYEMLYLVMEPLLFKASKRTKRDGWQRLFVHMMQFKPTKIDSNNIGKYCEIWVKV